MRLCPWSLALASSIPVFDLERVCPREIGPWPWPRIFLCPWPWPRALCPRLHSWSSPQISGATVSHHKLVSPENGDTRSGPPPLRRHCYRAPPIMLTPPPLTTKAKQIKSIG